MQSTSVSDPKAHLKSPKAPRSPKPPLSPNVRSTTQEQPDNLSLTDELDLPGPSPSLGSSETRRKRGSTLPGRLKRADGMMGSGSFSSSFLGSIFRGFIGQSSSSQGKCEEASSSPSVVKDLQKNLNLGGATTPNVLQRPYRDVGARYKLGKAIGSGTYGTVYLCTDNMTKEKLACKSVDKSRLKSIQDIMAVRAEVKALETVGGHPSVVSLKGVYEDLKVLNFHRLNTILQCIVQVFVVIRKIFITSVFNLMLISLDFTFNYCSPFSFFLFSCFFFFWYQFCSQFIL